MPKGISLIGDIQERIRLIAVSYTHLDVYKRQISGRGRLFEVKQRVKEANAGRQHDAPGRRLEGSDVYKRQG